jgi:hypothetical protein
MREEIGDSYAKKHEIITPKALITALALSAAILVAGMTVTVVVYDKINTVSHQDGWKGIDRRILDEHAHDRNDLTK